MGILVCTGICVEPSWEFFELQAAVSIVLWLLLLLLSQVWVLYLFIAERLTQQGRTTFGHAEQTEEWALALERRAVRTKESLLHPASRVSCCLALCIIFCIRSGSRAATEIDWLLELACAALLLWDKLMGLFAASLLGSIPCLTFWASSLPLECFCLGSALALAAAVGGQQTWASFSFLLLFHAVSYWMSALAVVKANLEVLRWRAIDAVVVTLLRVLLFTMTIMTFERMGDPQLFAKVAEGEWNLVSSLYYTMSVASTVGFPGMIPSTVLGKVLSIIIVCSGMTLVFVAARRINDVVVLQTTGGGYFDPVPGERHVVVAGTLSVEMAKDLILELLHPDHAEDAADLHVVFLLPYVGAKRALRDFLSQKRYRHLQDWVHVFQGSVMSKPDLLRVCADTAEAIFLLPNMQSSSPRQEDTETIMRFMAVRGVAPVTWVIMLLMKGASRELLKDTGGGAAFSIGRLTEFSVDELKLGLAGKGCQVAGFVPLLCNLVKCIGDVEDGDDEDEDGLRKLIDEPPELWQEEYNQGLGNEIYEVPLSVAYGQQAATFFQVVMDVLERTEGTVYLVGLVEVGRTDGAKSVIVNPGPKYVIKDVQDAEVSGIFVAADREAIVQCTVAEELLGPEVPAEENDQYAAFRKSSVVRQTILRPSELQLSPLPGRRRPPPPRRKDNMPELPEADVEPRLLGMLRGEPRRRCKQLVHLVQQRHRAGTPVQPSPKILAMGHHIVLICTNVSGQDEFRLGAEHFVRPLRQVTTRTTVTQPIVVLCPRVPDDWETVVGIPEVYFLQGSPTSEFHLDRANIQGAAAVFICNVGDAQAQRGSDGEVAEPWMVDAEPIRCARLVESRMPPGKESCIIVELASEVSHRLIPLAADREIASQKFARASAFAGDGVSARMLQAGLAEGGGWLSRLRGAAEGSLERLLLACGPATFDVHQRDSKLDYIRSCRYASGQLFVDDVVTALMANTLFNPSLCDLVCSMITATVTVVKVPGKWVGRPFLDFFVYLLHHKGDLAVGLMRRGTEDASLSKSGTFRSRSLASTMASDKRRMLRSFQFVYTAPPATATELQHTDRVICFRTHGKKEKSKD